MPEKKKTVAAKNIERRMSKPPVSKTAKPADPDKSASRPVAVAAEQSLDSAKQLAAFEAAMKLFHARKLREARELFTLAAQGPERDVAQRARLHIAMCDRRLQQAAVTCSSAEDYYNYGVALINTRNLAEARTAPGKGPRRSLRARTTYTTRWRWRRPWAATWRAPTRTSSGPSNWSRATGIIARQDADFAPLANQPPFDSLLYPEKKGW